MSKETKIRMNLDGLDAMRQQIGDTYKARVGIIGGHAQRPDSSGLNNAEIGLIMLVGSMTRNIPARNWLTMPIERMMPEIIKAMGQGAAKSAFDRGDFHRLFEILGIKAEEAIQMAFETAGFGTWPPNAPSTVRAKGSDAPLIDTGNLRKNITSEVVKKGDNGGDNGQAITG